MGFGQIVPYLYEVEGVGAHFQVFTVIHAFSYEPCQAVVYREVESFHVGGVDIAAVGA